MEPVTVILGHSISIADVQMFVVQFLIPGLTALFTALYVRIWKKKYVINVSLKTRAWVIRSLVFLLCLGLNLLGQYLTGADISRELLLATTKAYVTAIFLNDHLFRS